MNTNLEILKQLLEDKQREMAAVIEWLKAYSIYRNDSPALVKLRKEIFAMEGIIKEAERK